MRSPIRAYGIFHKGGNIITNHCKNRIIDIFAPFRKFFPSFLVNLRYDFTVPVKKVFVESPSGIFNILSCLFVCLNISQDEIFFSSVVLWVRKLQPRHHASQQLTSLILIEQVIMKWGIIQLVENQMQPRKHRIHYQPHIIELVRFCK